MFQGTLISPLRPRAAASGWHYYTDDNPDADFDDVDSADVAEAFETWRSECAYERERVAAARRWMLPVSTGAGSSRCGGS
jgi:hypothetical protein